MTSNPRCDFNCDDGWIDHDSDGRPIPCPNCKQHLSQCPDCQALTVRGWTDTRGRHDGMGHFCPAKHR